MPIVKAWDTAKGGDLFDYIEELKRKEKVEEIRSRATLIADFANNSYLVYEGITDNLTSRPFNDVFNFTRNSIATGENSLGLVEQTGVDQHRLVGKRKGLLVEESRTNLLTYSEEFDNAAWTKNNATITTDNTTAPDGSATADKLVEDGTTNSHEVEQTVSVGSGETYFASVYIAQAERTRVSLNFGGTAVPIGERNVATDVDLSKGIIVAGGNNITIAESKNGFYRLTISTTTDASGTVRPRVSILDDSGQNSYAGDGTSGIYIWGAQIEEGSFVTSYIPTAASSVVRDGDICTRQLTQEFNERGWTIFAKVKVSGDGFRIFALGDGGGTNRVILLSGSSGTTYRLFVETTSGVLIDVEGETIPNGLSNIALTFDGATYFFYLNGVKIYEEAGTAPSITDLHIGTREDGTGDQQPEGNYETLFMIPEALTADELKTLTDPDQ